ncbi:hypothetical protein ACH5RR_010373 [Cinchona calisaya]|uniref:YGGT family protein n=1 Tax=Cinchona calisaya TaxID=153742 RepID=A0ABD3AIS0_9GENT
MAASLMASQTLPLQNPRTAALLPPSHLTALSPPLLPTTSRHHLLLRNHQFSKPRTIRLYLTPPKRVPTIIASSSSTLARNRSSTSKPESLLTGSTRTVTTLLAIALAASKLFSHKVVNLAVGLRKPLIHAAGPAFFAAIRDTSTGTLNTPFTVVAAGMAKWLDIYSGVLMVRVLLSWFPNIPWDRQPLSAIRDLCDPYLNLFRNIIPPIFDTLDISPLLAFAVLGTLGSILKSSKGGF